MVRLYIFLIVFLVVNSFIMLEEESLVLLSSFIWLDAAGGIIREGLTSELEGRGDKIKETFSWYLRGKKNLVTLLIKKHETREDLGKMLSGVYELFINRLLNGVLASYGYNYIVVSNQERRNDISEIGMHIVNELSRREIQAVLVSPERVISGKEVWLDKNISYIINSKKA